MMNFKQEKGEIGFAEVFNHFNSFIDTCYIWSLAMECNP